MREICERKETIIDLVFCASPAVLYDFVHIYPTMNNGIMIRTKRYRNSMNSWLTDLLVDWLAVSAVFSFSNFFLWWKSQNLSLSSSNCWDQFQVLIFMSLWVHKSENFKICRIDTIFVPMNNFVEYPDSISIEEIYGHYTS